ncbi:MAG: hypothetical protein BroJett011_13350 [Chloroflexota bacterium]|nr:MAG: hypothetical protein BroJett011_13350 [Chloroflexota bacterium]
MSNTSDTVPRSGRATLALPLTATPARFISIAFPLTWETVLLGVILVTALVTRFWLLDARVMSHDESLHVYYSWQLASGKGFAHNPMMHGPFLFEATALMNVLFGANDFTSRLVPVILGILIVVAIPQLLKPWLGRAGALATSLLLLLSPYILYYSRYIRHDIQVIAWMLLLVVAIFRYRQYRRASDLTLLAVALALMFATMETTFIYLAIFTSFLALHIAITHRLRWCTLRRSAEFDLIILLTTLGAFFSAPIALLLLNPIWLKFSGAPFVEMSVLAGQGIEWAAGPTGLRLWSLLALFSIGAGAIGLWWGGKRWLELAGLFLAITITLFTTFFTNPAGLGTGFIGSLGYWLAQQEVARGGQPWYYYLIVFPLYEYLPLLGGVLAALYYIVRRKSLTTFSQAFVPFVLWWAGLLFIGLSLAGEKMPWLSTHLVVPFILLTGWWIGQLLEGAWSWRRGLGHRLRTIGRGMALGTVAMLALLTIRTSFAVNYVNYDYTTEFIGYAHGAPGVKWVLADIAAIANHTGIGRELKIAYDDEVSWPMVWYLREFSKQAFFSAEPNREALDAPVVIAGSKNWSKVEALLGNRYHRFEVTFRWWPLEDYKDLTWERLRNAFTDPARRAAIWDILWSRDYSRYAELTNQKLNPPADWPFASRMRIYVQKDVAAQMLSLSLGSTMLADIPAPVDAYTSVQRQVQPLQIITAGSLKAPRGLAVGPGGSIYVADTANSRIVRFDSAGNLLAMWGSRTPEGQIPPAPGTFVEPWGLAVDSQGNLFVADTWNHRVQKFDRDGKFLLEWGTAGQIGGGSDKFWGPRAITVSSTGRVYLTDTGNKRVVAFDLNGRFLFEFGAEGEGRLDEPVGIALNSAGEVYVADTWNRRVAVFSAEGQFLRSWPVQAWAGASLDNKPYLAVDTQGRVYVTDPEGYRVLVFSPTGEPVAAFGRYGSEEDAFGLPAGIALGPDGSIGVTDAGNNRVSHLAPMSP